MAAPHLTPHAFTAALALAALATGGVGGRSASKETRHVYYYPHCPKTGGASFAKDLLATIDKRRHGVRPCAHDMHWCWGENMKRTDTVLDKMREAQRHPSATSCNYATCELHMRPALRRAGVLLGAPRVHVLLLLRTPQAHVVSQYAHAVSRNPVLARECPTFSSWLARKQRELQFTNHSGWFPYNMQTSHLVSDGPGAGRGSGYGAPQLPPDALSKAKAVVDQALHVGVLEHYRAQYCLAVYHIWPMMPVPVPMCRCGNDRRQRKALNHDDHGTDAHKKVPTISASDRRIVDGLTRLDAQLYKHALERFTRDMRASPLPRCLMNATTK